MRLGHALSHGIIPYLGTTMSQALIDRILASKKRSDARAVAEWVIADPDRIAALMTLLQHDNKRICQRSSWPLVLIAQGNPSLLQPHLPTMAALLRDAKSKTLLRNVLRILSEIPTYGETYEGPIYESSYEILADPQQPIACRVFAMTVCSNIAHQYPDLAPELIATIQAHEPHGSPGFKVRSRDELKRLTALKGGG